MPRKTMPKDSSEMTFPNRCGQYRDAAGLTQQQVADCLGMSLSGYQYLEYGTRELKSGNILRLCAIFGCRPDDLIYFEH